MSTAGTPETWITGPSAYHCRQPGPSRLRYRLAPTLSLILPTRLLISQLMAKVLVTGGAGIIGFHTCLKLLARGDEVLGIDNLNGYCDPLQ